MIRPIIYNLSQNFYYKYPRLVGNNSMIILASLISKAHPLVSSIFLANIFSLNVNYPHIFYNIFWFHFQLHRFYLSYIKPFQYQELHLHNHVKPQKNYLLLFVVLHHNILMISQIIPHNILNILIYYEFLLL